AGDFNFDDTWTCEDVDGLYDAIFNGSSRAEFDMNGDGAFTPADVGEWLAQAGNVLLASGQPLLAGDANLDGTVDGADFLVWNDNKFTSPGSWCAGDFNADGTVDGADFVLWNSNKFRSADSVAVPEPQVGLALFWGSLLMGASLRRVPRTRTAIS
ncbi:MAG: hypothetical protein AAGF97_19515, partial [Planctomycetota bacterium]